MTEPDAIAGPIAILGAGREGRSAWRYLRARHPDLRLDLLDEAAPDPQLAEQLGPLDRLVNRPLDQVSLEQYALLVRSPGVSAYREPLLRARLAGVRVTTPTNLWFAAHPDARTVCITGTKGKSTTASLLAQMLAAAGRRVCLAGNIGRPLLDCEGEATAVDWWVIELSSYQIADLEARPGLAVLLNLSPEHLDWHGGEAAYRRDKLRLATLADGNPVIANGADPVLRDALAGLPNLTWFNDHGGIRVADGCLFDGDNLLQASLPPGLPGAHNLSNLAAALTVVRRIGEEVAQALAAAAEYRPLPHRLQLLGERDGCRFVDDSISSTPLATSAALETFAGQAVVLIVGGFDRGLDWTPHLPVFARRIPLAVIGVPDNGPRILEALRDAGIRPAGGLHAQPHLAAAVALARQLAPDGALVLLSPGAPSFPQFRDYRDRGRQFAALCGFDLDERDPWEK
jgi:UDP-N-acetylmuramoylalanine--D-glutamate ligase